MQFPFPLVPGTLMKRYKRFLADVRLDTGEEITAHCPNTGSMITLAEKGAKVFLSPKSEGLKYTWEIVENEGTLVTINTMLPNLLAFEAIKEEKISELQGYTSIKREVKYGAENSRVDLLLESPTLKPCYVEVKQVHLKRGKSGVFPDGVTARGSKHLREMMAEVQKGNRAVMLYVIQRGDVDCFEIATDIDPEYAKTAALARSKGVEFLAYKTDVSLNALNLAQKVPIF